MINSEHYSWLKTIEANPEIYGVGAARIAQGLPSEHVTKQELKPLIEILTQRVQTMKALNNSHYLGGKKIQLNPKGHETIGKIEDMLQRLNENYSRFD